MATQLCIEPAYMPHQVIEKLELAVERKAPAAQLRA
jgi:hypothetical protein